MNSAQNFSYAQLALAAYAQPLVAGSPPSVNALRIGGKGMSERQALEFASLWTVVDQFTEPESGVSATIFHKEGEFVLAIRGTEFQAGDLLADGLLALGVSARLNPQFAALNAKLAAWMGESGPLHNVSFAVTGHSLGGYLAAAVKEAHSAEVTQAYLFNSPGSGGLFGNIGDLASGVFAQATPGENGIWNIKASEGISFITGLGAQPSAGVPVQIEADPGIGFDNHSIVRLTDGLAIQAAYATLVPTLSSAQLNALIDATGSPENQTLEGALDALRKLLLGPNAKITTTEDREAFYANLYALTGSSEYQSLAGAPDTQITVLAGAPAATIAGLAAGTDAQGLATRYALKELNAFALSGADYSPLNADGALNLYDAVLRRSGLTTQYIADRANFLERKLWFSTEDRSPVDPYASTYDPDQPTSFINEPTSNLFFDVASGYEIRQGALFPSTHVYGFGGDNADLLVGQSLEDHLYGGFGNDLVFGGLGDNDYLEGGYGADVYNFASGDGTDTVLDTDGEGLLVRNGAALALGVKVSADVWQLGGTTYTKDGTNLQITFADTATDKITVRDFDFAAAEAGSYLGIRLVNGPSQPQGTALIGDKTLVDTDSQADGVQIGYDLWGNELTEDPALARDDALYGSDAASEHIEGREGNDVIFGDTEQLAAPGPRVNPVSSAVGAADFIEGGAGRDIVTAGPGDDWVEGGADGDILGGNDGNDAIYADSSLGQTLTVGQAISDGNVDNPTAGLQDLLTGDAGDDLLISSTGADYLAGGEGHDVIIGGAGDDNIYGDRSVTNAPLDWSVSRDVDDQGSVVIYSVIGSAGFATAELAGASDVIYAGAGNDWVFAGGGDDFVDTGPGLNVVLGEGGNDTIFGGPDRDILDGDSADSNANGTYGDDYVDGGGGGDTLFGGKGNDILIGGAGQDQLLGGDGDDVLYGGTDTDVLQGGDGKDTYLYFRGDGYDIVSDPDIAKDSQYLSSLVLGPGITKADVKFRLGSLVVDLGGGDALQFIGFDAEDPLSTPMLDAIEFSDGERMTSEDILAQGFDIDGTSADEEIYGTAVTDRILAGDGNDYVVAKAGDDTIDGGAGNDEIYAGEGNDTVTAGDGDDFVDGAGGDDTIDGGLGDDTLKGGDGADTISGGDGQDLIFGGAGDDVLSGGAGDDTIDGGAGNDALAGGTGSDAYLLYGGMGADTVTDGEAGETNVLQLGAGVSLETLATARVNDDLVVSLRGLKDSMTISDYYARAQDWVVRDTAGAETDLQTVINQPDPYGDDFIARLWADTRLGGIAQVMGAAYAIGWTPLDGDTFESFYESAYLGVAKQTTDYTYTRVDPPNDILAQTTTEDTSSTVLTFTSFGSPTFHWLLNSFEPSYVESDEAFVQAPPAQLPQTQSSGQALLTLKPDRQLTNLNYQSSSFVGPTEQVSYDTGNGTVDALVTSVIQQESYNEFADVTNVDLDTAVWPNDLNDVVTNRVLADMTRVEDHYLSVRELRGGPSDNYIFAGNAGLLFPVVTLIDGGAGNDTLVGDGGLLYGNSGDDQLSGADAILIGGDGDDTITGQGGSTFVYTATETGIDAISETATATETYLDWYYAALGVADWRESAAYGGEYRASVGDGGTGYFATLEQAQQSGGSDITFVDPLPVSAPVVGRSDAATLEALESEGVLKRDVVSFGPGVSLADLDLTVQVMGKTADAHPEEPWYGGGTLSVRWGSGAGFDVTVPEENYGLIGDDLFATVVDSNGSTFTAWEGYQLGLGIEAFEFADGARYSLDEALQQAAIERLYGYQFVRGTGSQVISTNWASVDFAADITPSDLYVVHDGTNDLVFGVVADSALGRIPGWYSDPGAIPQMEFHFADGTVYDVDSVTRFGRTQTGSSFGDQLFGDPYFASALVGLGGDDALVGGAGNDLLDGGPGFDTAYGQGGDDIYLFGADSDIDIIYERVFGDGTNGTDTVRFSADVAATDLSADRSFDTLILTVGSTGAQLRLDGWFGELGGSVENFEFAEGTVWHATEIEALLPAQVATSGDDLLLGLSGDDVIDGLEGDDVIYGFAGNDTLRGGPGKDTLLGLDGDDTYVFELGDGYDQISDQLGTNTLRLGAGIDPQTVSVTRDYGSIYLQVPTTGDRVGIYDWTPPQVAQVVFDDGTVWSAADLASRVTLVAATEFGDILWGTEGSNAIDGLGGDDEIYGNGGNDVLSGGDGADYLEAGPGFDLLRGGTGDDDLEAWDAGNNFLDAGAGDDYLYYESPSVVIGGPGDDWVDAYGPYGVVAFNPGDGQDTIYAGDFFTLSIGGGISPADLSLSQDGDDIVLDVGGTDSVRLTGDDPGVWPTIILQLFGSVDVYNFKAAIDAFYNAKAADPGLTDFALGDVLPGQLLLSSETGAVGGAIAYRYATTASTFGLSNAQILSVLQDGGLGSQLQSITVAGGNSAPVVDNPIVDQSTNEDAAFSFAVPAGSFSDPDADTLAYAATLDDGSALPAWLSFDAQTQTFSGTPLQADVGAIDVKVTATDGGGLSAEDTFALTVVNVNDAPVVSATDSDLLLNDSTLASTLFSVFDEDGQAPTQYEFFDDVEGGGYFSANGTQKAAGVAIPVSATDLANTEYVAGATPGTERVWARAYDGEAWSAWKSWSMTSALHIPDAAPQATPTAATQTVLLDETVAASSLFSVLDADGDPVAGYEFWDSTAGNGHFTVNGVEQGVNVAIAVSAADLANTEFVGGAEAGSDQVWVRATDGQSFGAWKSWTMNSWPHETNSAPSADAPDSAVLRGQAVAAQSLFSVSDADGDAIASYEFWDDTPGGGYFSLSGVEQTNNPIPVTAAQVGDVEYVGGADPGTEQVWVRASDGLEWGAWESWNMTTALHIPNAAPEATPTAAAQVVLLGQAVDASTLFGATDADGDAIAEYQFQDSTAGNGFFTVNGVEQAVGANIVVAAADLANTQFVGGAEAGSDQVWVRASDGQSYGAWTSWTMNSWPHATNAAPVADATSATLLTDEVASASALFSVSDADGDAAAKYEFWDDVAGGGYWRVNDVQQASGQAIPVDAADLANTEYVGGANPGSAQVWVRVNDGLEWGAWKNWTMTTALHIPNAAPEVSASTSTVLLDQSVDAGSLFSATDADGDAITQYELWDSTAGNGYFAVDGVEQGVNVAIGVTAAQLADTQFVASADTGSDTVWARAYDGMAWSSWQSWTMNSWPHATNAAPVVTAANAGLLRNEAMAASMFFGVSDADGDAVASYEFWDDVNGGGYWALDGAPQASGQAIPVAAADLAGLAYVGGANAGTEQVWVRASDGMGWSPWKNWLMATEGGMLRGGDGPDTLNGEAGPTILEGGAGNDVLTDTDGNNLFSGGEGDDTMTGGEGDDLFAGGAGNDVINTGAGSNVIAYNAGGGIDTVYAAAGAANTLSFGGGIGYDDLSLSKNGNDLIVSAGANDQVVLKDWYAGSKSVLDLQIILDATSEFDANSSDPLYNRKVQTFDFAGLVAEFDDALAQSPGLTSWAVTNALLAFHLSGADDAAIGGDLAYWYGKNNGFTGISLQAAQQAIGAPGFGSDAQTLHPFSGLQEGYVKLA